MQHDWVSEAGGLEGLRKKTLASKRRLSRRVWLFHIPIAIAWACILAAVAAYVGWQMVSFALVFMSFPAYFGMHFGLEIVWALLEKLMPRVGPMYPEAIDWFTPAMEKWESHAARCIDPGYQYYGGGYSRLAMFNDSGFAPEYRSAIMAGHIEIAIDDRNWISGYRVHATVLKKGNIVRSKVFRRSRMRTVFDGSVFEISSRGYSNGFLLLAGGGTGHGNVNVASGFVRENYRISTSDVFKAHELLTPAYCQRLEEYSSRAGLISVHYKRGRLFVAFPRHCCLSDHTIKQPITEQVLAERSGRLRIYYEFLRGIQADFSL